MFGLLLGDVCDGSAGRLMSHGVDGAGRARKECQAPRCGMAGCLSSHFQMTLQLKALKGVSKGPKMSPKKCGVHIIFTYTYIIKYVKQI